PDDVSWQPIDSASPRDEALSTAVAPAVVASWVYLPAQRPRKTVWRFDRRFGLPNPAERPHDDACVMSANYAVRHLHQLSGLRCLMLAAVWQISPDHDVHHAACLVRYHRRAGSNGHGHFCDDGAMIRARIRRRQQCAV